MMENRWMDHYHISGLMADDEGLPALTLREAIWELIERARMEEDHRASSAYSLGDERGMGEGYSPTVESKALAWDEIRIAERYSDLADDLSRFDRYLSLDAEGLRREEYLDRTEGESPEILPPIYFIEDGGYRLMEDGSRLSLRLAIEQAARVALGIESGWRRDQQYRDLFDLEIWDCPREIGWDPDGVAWDRDPGDEEDLLPYPPDADPRILADLGLYRDPEAGEIREISASEAGDQFLADHIEIIPVAIPSPSDDGGER